MPQPHTLSCCKKKKKIKKNQENGSYLDDDVTNYVRICAKLCKKTAKIGVF